VDSHPICCEGSIKLDFNRPSTQVKLQRSDTWYNRTSYAIREDFHVAENFGRQIKPSRRATSTAGASWTAITLINGLL
jgi:hypothetical protein